MEVVLVYVPWYLFDSSGVERSAASVPAYFLGKVIQVLVGKPSLSDKDKQSSLKTLLKIQEVLCLLEFTLFHIATWLEDRNLT